MAGLNLDSLNESQRAVATRLDEPLFVAAGAGSGKTFTLTARLVHALSKGSAPDGGRYLESIDQALIITFTKAAAQEIAERVRGALRAAGADDPHLYAESLKVDGAWISTIHSMCSRILHRHAVELGIDPKFKLCEGSVADALMARALDEVLSEVPHDPAFARLCDAYPLWGSGTSISGMIDQLRTEASKCIHGLDDFAWPHSDETPALMAQLRHALQSVCALQLTKLQDKNAHAALESIDAYFELPPGERTCEVACAALAGCKIPSLRKAEQRELSEEARSLHAQATVCAHFERVQDFVPQLVELARRVDASYARQKLELSYLDNDDLIGLALAAVEQLPEVASDYAGRFRLVMIDEFQDTDERQLRLVGLLAGEGQRHLTTVGDAQQSIYRFRGGDVEVFRARGRALPEESHVQMDVNYRSDPHVLAFVERVCGDTGILGDFLKLAADGGRRTKFVARDDKDAEPPRMRLEVATGGTSELTSAVLAAQLADRLAQYHAQGQSQSSMALLLGTTTKVELYLDALRARGLDAVVTGGSSFSNTPEVGVMQALLHTLANPHDTETGLFRLLSSDMFRLDADDFCQLGTRAQEKLDAPTKRAVETCFVDGELRLFADAEPSARLASAHAVLSRAFERLGRWKLADVCQAVLDESGWLARLESAGDDGLVRAANLLASVRYVRELTQDLGLGAARAADEFDRWLTAAKLTPKSLAGDEVDAVRVMTVHGSKGLQYGVCAVSECWSDPRAGGALSVGRRDGVCMVCAVPKTDIRSFSTMRKAIPVPERWEDCRTPAEWSAFLDGQEVMAEAGEKARLLYVALTRAEEALVVGLPVAEKEQYRSTLALGVLSSVMDLDDLVPGEGLFGFAPQLPMEVEVREEDPAGGRRILRHPVDIEPGVARVVCLSRGENKEDPWLVNSAGTLEGFDGELPESVTLVPLLGTQAQGKEGHNQSASFALYDLPPEEPPARGWRPRAGVFSYSSAHARMERERLAAWPAKEERPTGEGLPTEGSQFAEGSLSTSVGQPVKKDQPADGGLPAKRRPSSGKLPPAPSRSEQDAEAEGAAYTPDADKATSLGSAFHELAQTMVETRRDHDASRLEALCRTWKLTARQTSRLQEAIARWETSDLRREVWQHGQVRAEVPFFCAVDSRFGNYVEGAIDLLATDAGSDAALVVDYKTGDIGLDFEQIEERHRMQANFYAWVLRDQGFRTVDCAFCCVEVDDGSGAPVVVRYHFDDTTPPHMD